MSTRIIGCTLIKTFLLGTLPLTFVCLISTGIQAAQLVYSNDFEAAVGSEWSNRSRNITPSGRKFLGQFNNGTVSLKLSDLPSHTNVTVSFDLFVIGSWDGNGDRCCGPDIFNVRVAGGSTLLHTTFSNGRGLYFNGQAYPGNYTQTQYLGLTGADEINSLGYRYNGFPLDSVYNLTFTFSHLNSLLKLDFSAFGLQEIWDESWGLDNVKVSITPTSEPKPEPKPKSVSEPASVFGLLAFGAFGVGSLLKRKQQQKAWDSVATD